MVPCLCQCPLLTVSVASLSTPMSCLMTAGLTTISQHLWSSGYDVGMKSHSGQAGMRLPKIEGSNPSRCLAILGSCARGLMVEHLPFSGLNSGQLCGTQHGAQLNCVHCVIPDPGRLGPRNQEETTFLSPQKSSTTNSMMLTAHKSVHPATE